MNNFITQVRISSPGTILIIIILICACTRKHTQPDPMDSVFKKSLIQRRVPNTSYTISLPRDYSIKENRGPDFSVYYFYPTDISNLTSFSGGFYLGNAPGGFGMDSDSCKEEKLRSYVLGDAKEWTIYNCNNKYRLQIITETKNREWPTFIHAFGRGITKAELNKLLDVYSTLKEK